MIIILVMEVLQMDLDKKEYDMIIPIGENCQPAFYLRETGLRVVAYPFDWQIIKLKTKFVFNIL